MNTLFTSVEAAIEEAHFIQHELNKTAYIVTDVQDQLHVITADQYARDKWAAHRVLEIFHLGGCNEHKRVFPKPAKSRRRQYPPRVPRLYRSVDQVEDA